MLAAHGAQAAPAILLEVRFRWIDPAAIELAGREDADDRSCGNVRTDSADFR
jgi:hypothetical protein